MKKHTKLALFILIIGTIIAIAWRFVAPIIADMEQAKTTDASGKKGTIFIGIDSWVGYFPLCSPEIKKRLYKVGYALKCIDDAANYKDRFDNLNQGKYQFAVATVDSYLLNGEAFDYPGPIVTVIDESKGGDAIIALKSKISSLDVLKSSQQYKIAFTANSPSHHLIKAISSHFDIKSLNNKAFHLQTNGSEAALKSLLNREVDVAVVWEPEVTKALANKDIIRLLGTEDTKQLIVDVLIASQKTVKNDPELVNILLKEYFRTLKFYRDHNDKLIDDVKDHYSVNSEQSSALLKGVKWASLQENVTVWYGLNHQSYSDEALIMSIESATDILLESNDFTSNPIPDEDPYRLINSRFIETLNKHFASGNAFNSKKANTTDPTAFNFLTEQQWDQLSPIGSLKTRHIVFVSGTSELTHEGKIQIDEQISDLSHYPNFRIEIQGHSGIRGNKEANLLLSKERANAVLRYIDITQGLSVNRARAIGFGSTKPLLKRPGESSRRYNYRLPRVEIKLVRETI